MPNDIAPLMCEKIVAMEALNLAGISVRHGGMFGLSGTSGIFTMKSSDMLNITID